MKNNILVIFSLLLSFFTSAQRPVFGLRGMSTTSSGSDIDGILKGASDIGYKIKYLQTVPHNYDPSTGVAASTTLLNEELKKEDVIDVLGIAHDYGGIVMKNMAKNSKQLSALILDGVPNNGSEAIQKMLEKDGNDKPRLQQTFSQLKALTGVEGCPSCNLEEKIVTFIESIQANKVAWKDIVPSSPFVKTKPSIPYAIIWGNIGNKGLSSLMSSYISPSNTKVDFYGSCINDKDDAQLVALTKAKDKAVLNAVFSTYDNLVGLISPIKFNAKDSTISGIKAEGISKLVKGVIDNINSIKDADDNLKKLLKCEVYVNLLNAQWNLTLSGNQFSTIQTPVKVISKPLEDCLVGCDNEPDPQVAGWCVQECYNNYEPNQTTTTTYNVISYATRPHDGLLTDVEQKLDGAAKTYKVEYVNHFQETDWTQSSVNGAFIDLFNGGAGVAFVVPK